MSEHLLTWMTFSPLVGIPLILLLPERSKPLAKWVALVATLVPLALAVPLYLSFDATLSGVDAAQSFQFVERATWIEAYDIHYSVGVDGLSISMVLLTALICPICILASFGIAKAERAYFALFLLLETGMIGTFVALDLVLFYVFWEVMLLPMYFLIGVWGGPRRVYAAIKFFLYTLAGSVLMLLGILALYFYSGGDDAGARTFDLLTLIQHREIFTTQTIQVFGWMLPFTKAVWIGFFIAFAIKIPMFPFHTWLPDAHVEAPTAISVILAGVLLKMGTYGIFRFNFPLFPDATLWAVDALAVFGVINIVYGALCAMAQKDLKKLVAYSSVSHMGFVLLGMAALTSQGLVGGLFQMFTHGTVTAMLFLLVGVIYDRAHHRQIEGFGGLATIMPRYAVFVGFAFFAGLGLPGMSSFVSEFLCLLGAFRAYPQFTIVAVSGVVFGAAYLLWTLQRMFFGDVNEKYRGLPDISFREVVSLVPLAILVLGLGFYPMPVLDLMSASVERLIHVVGPDHASLAQDAVAMLVP